MKELQKDDGLSKQSCPSLCDSGQEHSSGTDCSSVWQQSGLGCSCLWGGTPSTHGCSSGCPHAGLTPGWEGKLRQSGTLGAWGIELGHALQWVMAGARGMGELRESEAFPSKDPQGPPHCQHATPALASIRQPQAKSSEHHEQRLLWLRTNAVAVHGMVLPCA